MSAVLIMELVVAGIGGGRKEGGIRCRRQLWLARGTNVLVCDRGAARN